MFLLPGPGWEMELLLRADRGLFLVSTLFAGGSLDGGLLQMVLGLRLPPLPAVLHSPLLPLPSMLPPAAWFRLSPLSVPRFWHNLPPPFSHLSTGIQRLPWIGLHMLKEFPTICQFGNMHFFPFIWIKIIITKWKFNIFLIKTFYSALGQAYLKIVDYKLNVATNGLVYVKWIVTYLLVNFGQYRL